MVIRFSQRNQIGILEAVIFGNQFDIVIVVIGISTHHGDFGFFVGRVGRGCSWS